MTSTQDDGVRTTISLCRPVTLLHFQALSWCWGPLGKETSVVGLQSLLSLPDFQLCTPGFHQIIPPCWFARNRLHFSLSTFPFPPTHTPSHTLSLLQPTLPVPFHGSSLERIRDTRDPKEPERWRCESANNENHQLPPFRAERPTRLSQVDSVLDKGDPCFRQSSPNTTDFRFQQPLPSLPVRRLGSFLPFAIPLLFPSSTLLLQRPSSVLDLHFRSSKLFFSRSNSRSAVSFHA